MACINWRLCRYWLLIVVTGGKGLRAEATNRTGRGTLGGLVSRSVSCFSAVSVNTNVLFLTMSYTLAPRELRKRTLPKFRRLKARFGSNSWSAWRNNVLCEKFHSWSKALPALVLREGTWRVSTMKRLFSANFADSATHKAWRRTFLFKSNAWLRGTGGNTDPPPLKWGARIDPWRARPVPFCFHGFLPPPRTSDLVLPLWVPCRDFARCHSTTEWTRSLRMGCPNTLQWSATTSFLVFSKV